MKYLLALFFLVSSVSAEPYYGYDILGLAKQPIKMIAEEFEPGYCVGVLQGTFGNVIPNLKKLLNTGKVACFRAHLGNGVCKRNNNCGPGEFKPHQFKVLRNRIIAFENLATLHPGVKCYLSPYLEHDEKNKEIVKAWGSLIRKHAPSCEVVVNAFTGYVPPDVIQEKHGSTVEAASISTDGISYFDVDTVKFRENGTLLVFAWINRFNLRTSGEKYFTQPLKRTAKVTRDNMKHVTRLLKPEHPKPTTNCKDIKRPNLWKTNSEDYNTSDPREDRPLFISKKKVNRYRITREDGTVVGCARYYGPYSGGGYRHYVGDCSGDSGVTLMNKAGCEWVYLRGGGECFITNAIRRKGYVR